MKSTEFGNFTIGEITKMKVDFLGRDLFCDTAFCETEKELSWSNFIDKIYNGENLNLEKTHKFDKRANDVICEILKRTITENKDDKKEVKEFAGFIILFFVHFFQKLSKNINEVFTGDFSKRELFQYFFYAHAQEGTGSKFVMGSALPKYDPKFRAEKGKPIVVRKIITKYFEKDTKGYYRLSMEKANEAIRQEFKNNAKKLDVLKTVVDTNRGNSLKHPSTTWNVLRQLLNNQCESLPTDAPKPFDGISEETRISYIDSYLSYYFLEHFLEIAKEYISDSELTELIDCILGSTKYRILSVDGSTREAAEKFKKFPTTKSEYAIYNGFTTNFNGKIDTEFFYYNRNSSEDMQSALNYEKNFSYADEVTSRIKGILCKNFKSGFVVAKIDSSKEKFFLENLCTEDFIGKSCKFYYNWYNGIIEYANYSDGKGDLTNSLDSLSNAFNDYRYFAGNKLKDFCEMYMHILLDEWKITKKSGKIKDLWQFAVSQNLVLEVYKDFKESKFEYPFENPWEFMIRLWNGRKDVLEISKLFGLDAKQVQQILQENEKYLTRKDDDMYRFIPQWEEDEMYGDDDF